MADSDDLLLASIKALAAKEGKSPEEILADMLKARAAEKRGESAPSTALAGPVESGVERYQFKRTSMTSPHLSPERIAMYENESAVEARERWYAEESMMDGGVLSPGGMSGGGIFGDAVVASEGYDPASQMRYERRAGSAVQLKTLQVLQEMNQQLRETREENKQLREAAVRARLPGRRGR